MLTYASGKIVSEADINSEHIIVVTDKGPTYPYYHPNHIIVRLGSVYGYSGDNMRINIMPNLFSKIASQDGTISLFGGGIQYKSLVNVIDVVRAMKFLAESNNTGTYHLSNENMTVADVANICKKVNSKVTLITTDDEVPNKGYTLSNKKLLSTGFKFLYNIEDAIRGMVTRWSAKEQSTQLEYIQRGGKEYIDARGRINNYEITEPINLIGYIESTKGSVRANHYHPIQEQKCLLISGRYVSVIKDLSYTDAPVEYKIIRPGDIAVIRPNVAHTMVFLQDSVFLNLVRGEREHENYGITHTIPYILVDEEHRNRIMNEYSIDYRTTCRCCGSYRLEQVVNLGDSPLANNLLDSADQQCHMYPLELDYCPQCYNVQLSVVVPASKMFDNYLYVSSTSPVFRKHFEDAALQYIEQFNLTPFIDEGGIRQQASTVWDIGSNDGVFLKPLKERGINVVGIEPAKNLAQLANDNSIPTINGYFNQEAVTQAYHMYGSPAIITASNVFAHADDLAGITRLVFDNLQPEGVFIIEVQYLMDTIRDMTFDNIYHEHVNYWSVTALNNFFNILGYHMFHVEHVDTHGGSIRCFISKDNRNNDSVQEYLDRELELGVNRVSTFRDFGRRIGDIKKQVQENMKLLQGKRVCGYGSPAKATTALNYFGIDSSMIQYTIEDNALKQGKFIPGMNIPIVAEGLPEVCIVLAWNFFDSIVANCKKKGNISTTFASIKDLQLPTWEFRKLIDPLYNLTVTTFLEEYTGRYNHWLQDNEPEGSYIKILPYLKDIENGFFVEAGAHNGSLASSSNTKILEDCGWTGTLIEPCPDLFMQCEKNRPNSIVLRAALTSCENTTGSVSDDDIQVMGHKMGQYSGVPFQSIADEDNLTHIDFFALDVEGYEIEVLKGIDFDRLHISWMLIECNTDHYSYEELQDFMTSKGYIQVANISNFTKENTPSWPGTHQDYLYKKITNGSIYTYNPPGYNFSVEKI